jgi:hypothetical protein
MHLAEFLAANTPEAVEEKDQSHDEADKRQENAVQQRQIDG